MAIISNSNNLFCEHHFVFIQDSIVLLKQQSEAPLTKADLPSEETLHKCLATQTASDWFAEPDLNYSAMMLEKDAPVPAGCRSIPLRQFFWDASTHSPLEEQGGSNLVSLASRAHSFLRQREQHRFCPTCGGKLTDDHEQTAKKCSICGRLLFPRIEPAVIVLVEKGPEVLLAKNKNRHSDVYSCIAGFVEQGETVEHAVIREVKEETGLDVGDIQYKGSQSWPFPDQLMLAFTAQYKGGALKMQESELDDLKWFKKDCIPQPQSKPGSAAYNLIHDLFGK